MNFDNSPASTRLAIGARATVAIALAVTCAVAQGREATASFEDLCSGEALEQVMVHFGATKFNHAERHPYWKQLEHREHRDLDQHHRGWQHDSPADWHGGHGPGDWLAEPPMPAVPEPDALSLTLAGGLLIMAIRRRQT